MLNVESPHLNAFGDQDLQLLSTLAGTLCAYGLWKRGSTLLSGSLYLSLVTPEIVTGISLLALFQWAFRFLHWQLDSWMTTLL